MMLTFAAGAGLLALLVMCCRPHAGRALPAGSAEGPTRRPVIETVGRAVTRYLPGSSDPLAEKLVGRGIAVGVACMLIAPSLGIMIVLLTPVRSVRLARRRANMATTASIDALSEVVDLFAMALGSGATVTTAVQQAAAWAPDPLGEQFEHCLDDLRIGKPLSDALEAIPPRSGNHTRPLIAALVAHDRYGAPIMQNLSQLAADARLDRRRRAEADARRLPVTLLFPLVVCVLPAFLLLTVVPVVAETLTSLTVLASL